MATMNVDIVGISKLKCTGMGEFNSDELISSTVGKIPLKKWSSPYSQQTVQNVVFGCNLKND